MNIGHLEQNLWKNCYTPPSPVVPDFSPTHLRDLRHDLGAGRQGGFYEVVEWRYDSRREIGSEREVFGVF